MTVLIAGYTGLVGSSIARLMKMRGESFVGVNSKNLNLLDRKATFEFVNDVKPDLVIDAAAIVGGINANNSYPVDFLSKNVQMQTNLMDASHSANVERLVFLGSSCIYPRDCKQPIKEESLLTGPLEQTNSAYAIAKIAGIELVKAYRKQFNRNWISLMPTNMYGPNDNFDLNTSHVLPAFINRFVNAYEQESPTVTLWGTGTARREFLHVDDFSKATLMALEKYNESQQLNVGSGEDLTVFELASLVANLVGFRGKINWDSSKPDGTPRKVLDVTNIKKIGWVPEIPLKEGIASTIEWFKENENRLVKRY